MSTLHRQLCGIVSALQTYEHYIIGSPFPIYLYCDHKPILYLWGRKGQLSHRFFKYQVIFTKFQNLKINWTKGFNLALPNILSRNVTLEETKNLQKLHKEISVSMTNWDRKYMMQSSTMTTVSVEAMTFFLSFVKRAKIKDCSISRMTERNMK